MFIDSEKITCREIQEIDVGPIVELLKNSDLKFFNGGRVFEMNFKKLKKRIFDRQQDKKRRFYKLVVLKGNLLIGYCSLRVMSWQDLRADLAYFIVDEFAGRGYASEAARLTIRFAFEKLGLHRLSAKIADANVASIKVAEKIGMKRESVLKDYKFINGRWYDYFHYVVLNQKN